MDKIKSTGLQVIDERKTGVIVWIMPDGRIVQDDEGHIYSLPARKGDERRMNIMRESVYKDFGIDVGQPKWVSNRQVTDEEYDHQVLRAEWGMTPDPMDDVQEDLRNGRLQL